MVTVSDGESAHVRVIEAECFTSEEENNDSDTLTTACEELLDVMSFWSRVRLSTTVTFVIQERNKNTS